MSYDQVFHELRLKFCNHLKTVTGLTDVFYRGTEFKKPSGMYITYHLQASPRDYVQNNSYDEDGYEIFITSYRLVVSIEVYRDDTSTTPISTASGCLHNIRASFDRRRLMDQSFGDLVSFNRTSTPSTDALTIGGVGEQRASMTAIFSFSVTDKDAIAEDFIETVEFTINGESI